MNSLRSFAADVRPRDLRAPWRRSRAHHRPARAPQRHRRADGRAAHRGLPLLRRRRRRARARTHRRRRARLLRRCRPQGDRELRPAPRARGRSARLLAPDLAQADDRRHLGLVSRRRAGAGAVVRPAHRHRGRQARLHRAALRRAADRRGHTAPASDRRAGPRARHDPDRPDRGGRRGARHRARDRDRRARRSTSTRALEYAEALAAFPQDTMLADRSRGARGHRPALREECASRRARPGRRWPRPGPARRASPRAKGAAAQGPGSSLESDVPGHRGHRPAQVLRQRRGRARGLVLRRAR